MTEDEPVSELDIHLPGVTFDGDNEYLDIEGDAKALGELADAVERASSISVGDSKQPGHIVIRRNDSKLSIGYDGSALTLAGDDAGLNKFAEVLRLVAGGPQKPSGVQYHAHFDPYPRDQWLAAAENTALIIWLRSV
jgi:hypothetical protein